MAARKRTKTKEDRSHTPAIARSKKALFALVVVFASLALLEILLALLGVKPSIASQDPYLGFQSSVPLFERERDATGESIYRTAPNKHLLFNEQSFLAKKAPNSYRIFCMGGSTTHGRPYRDKTSFVGWLRRFLLAADPNKNWEVINCGGVSYASYRVAALMEELVRYEPDLFVVYTGQNEFLERRTYSGMIEAHPVFSTLRVLSARSRIASSMRSLIGSFAPDQRARARQKYLLTGEVKPLLDTTAGMDLYHRDDSQQAKIIDHFRFNLGRMITIARASGAKVIFIQPAVNAKDFSPFKSAHDEDLGAGEIPGFERMRAQSLDAAESGDYESAKHRMEQAVRIDDRFAAAHYELGKAFLALGELHAAEQAFERALVEDICPLRILPEMNDAITDIALTHKIPLVDFRAYLRDRCVAEHGHSILGREYFLDHVHPTLDMHAELGRLLLKRMTVLGIVTPAADWNDARADRMIRDFISSLDPREHGIARGLLAKVLTWAGKTAEADRLLDSAADTLRNTPEGCALLGKRLGLQGRTEEAIAMFKRALAMNPNLQNGYVGLAAAYNDSERLPEAAQALRELVKIAPESDTAHLQLALVLSRLRQTEQAEKHLQRVEQLNPNHPELRTAFGFLRVSQGRNDDALEEFRSTLRDNPNSTEALAQIGFIFRKRGRNEQALEYLRSALDSAPRNVSILRALASLSFGQNKADEAMTLYSRLVEIEPDNAEAHFYVGVLFTQQNEPRKAIASFERSVELAPRSRTAYLNLGIAHTTISDYRQAILAFRRAVEIWPEDAEFLAKLALLLSAAPQSELRNGEEALQLARHAVELTPNDPYSLDALAAAYAENGDFSSAVSTSERGLNVARAQADEAPVRYIRHHRSFFKQGEPFRMTSADVGAAPMGENQSATAFDHNPLVETAAGADRLDEAIRSYSSALDVRPDDPGAHFGLAFAYQRAGRLEEAASHYEKTIALNPAMVEAHHNLGHVLGTLGRSAASVRSYEKAVALDPDFEQSHYNLAFALARLDRLSKAREHFEAVIRINPQSVRGHRHLARVLSRLEEFEAADRHFRAAVRLEPENANVHADYAQLLTMQGRLAEAQRHLETALRINPNHRDARSTLDWVEREQGR